MNNIRNFSIIAHINHGKSTLSDRIIQLCGGHFNHEIESQILDSMDIERERGITIKAQSVTLNYKSIDDTIYQLNLIDTPGHIDFHYEVSRSLAACEGALLIIDARQGIEAQTLVNYYTAANMNLKVIPVLNKIDLLIDNFDRIKKEIKDIIGIDSSDIVQCSAKTGIGVIDVLEHLIKNVPPPTGDICAPLQALIIDSWFDNYLGIVSLICIKNGTVRKGEKIKVMSTNRIYNIDRLGIFTPKPIDCTQLKCGEVGWLICGIKDIFGAPVGDTLTGLYKSATRALPGFKKIRPQVYASLFPINSNDYKTFHDALNKLSLNDSSLSYEPEKSIALGFGFRCGFLGLLHMEITQERLEREYNLSLIATTPTVVYEIKTVNKEIIYVDNPCKLPSLHNIIEIREPIAECRMFLPKDYLGSVIALCIRKRGVQTHIVYHDKQVELIYEIPMAEIIFDFFNHLKFISKGYASLDYNFVRFQISNLVRVDVLINREPIDALASITHSKNALRFCQELIKKIKDLIPRQQFDVVIQATINNRIVTRSIVKQLRKDVLEKCHGGDVNRKKKLLQKQKEGKKRMKKIGKIEIPKEVFLAILSTNENNRK